MDPRGFHVSGQEGGLVEPRGSRMVQDWSRNVQEGEKMDKEGIKIDQEGKRRVKGSKEG